MICPQAFDDISCAVKDKHLYWLVMVVNWRSE